MEAGALSASVISGASAISLMALATLAVAAVLWLLRRASLRGQIVRHEPTWGCAYDTPTPRMQYTASSFAAPLLSVFGPLSGIRVERSAGSVRTHPVDLVLDGVALPALEGCTRATAACAPCSRGACTCICSTSWRPSS